MENQDTFTTYNPIINFVFFIGAIVFGMFFVHPGFLIASVILSMTYYLTVKRVRALKLIAGMIPVFLVLSAINPLFNTYGERVLFTYFNRPYTLEALYYGMALAAMFVSIIMWFASYNSVMTSDKFLYIFGKAAPSISLVLSMVLRFMPNYERRVKQISGARKCIGKAGASGTRREKIQNSMIILSSLTTWAFEGGIITADSMGSRGYGSGKRTTFSIYRFDTRDITLLGIMSFLIAVVLWCGIMGGAKVTYTPKLMIRGLDNFYSILGIISYGLFLMIPTILNIREAVKWHILKSKI